MRPAIEGTRNYYTVMEGKEFRKLCGGLVEEEVNKEDSDYEEGSNEE